MPTKKKAMMCYVDDQEFRSIKQVATLLGMSVSKYLIFSAFAFGRIVVRALYDVERAQTNDKIKGP